MSFVTLTPAIVVFGQGTIGAAGRSSGLGLRIAAGAQQSAGIARRRLNAAASASDQGQSRSSFRWVRRP